MRKNPLIDNPGGEKQSICQYGGLTLDSDFCHKGSRQQGQGSQAETADLGGGLAQKPAGGMNGVQTVCPQTGGTVTWPLTQGILKGIESSFSTDLSKLSWERIRLQCRRPWFNSWVGKIRWRRDRLPTLVFLGFPGGSVGKESACSADDLGSIPLLGRYPGGGKGYPLQYSGLEYSMDCISNVYTNTS